MWFLRVKCFRDESFDAVCADAFDLTEFGKMCPDDELFEWQQVFQCDEENPSIMVTNLLMWLRHDEYLGQVFLCSTRPSAYGEDSQV